MEFLGLNPINITAWLTTAQAENGQTKAPRAVNQSEPGEAWA